ncbi:hypothetical protein R80B4_02678 [Fibrobacteres bacterium R8-0-B4]
MWRGVAGFPRREGSGIKTGVARFYGAREGEALPLKYRPENYLFI